MSLKSYETSERAPFLTEPVAIQEGLRLGGAGVWRWKLASESLEWTANLESVHHLPTGSFDGSLASFARDLHPDDATRVWREIHASIEHGVPYRTLYRTSPRDQEPDVWIETSGGVSNAADGSTYLTGVCLDVTDRVRSELELKKRLAQQSAVADFGSFALGEPDFTKVLDGAVAIAASTLGVPLAKILQFSDSADHLLLRSGLGWADGLVGHGRVGIEKASQAGYTLMVAEPVLVQDLKTETRFTGPQLLHDHGVRSGISVVIPGSAARPFGVFGIHTPEVRTFDRTDAEFLQSLANIVASAARQADSAKLQSLLIREMAHRAGNMLQLVTSIAGQTFKFATDPQEGRRSFTERLGALAKANHVVSRGGWTTTRFSEMVAEALQPFSDRIVTSGRDILLAPELAFDLGLVLHELATNSVKYGSLGQRDGTVAISWSHDPSPDRFRFEWQDPQSSPRSDADRSGFGSKLVRGLIEDKWKGRVTVSFAPCFAVRLDIPFPRS